ncbi:restriction endonuclease subunit S [Vibrio parahaemolyticus]|uniref:restriction endonuclease subunit S n=1 Tax=Vibrio parahaemolyticus TaxID=670 RepID=UPI00111D26F3|nr:restriction endonuclease subunit S [Vibrio parahaemolyticus]HDU8585537.1 restriction endonuclease subunit S [Vibrio alginolyticus]EJC6802714.1 restriction endonuclease subunit S [Vibrio parahaemolyticus]ELA8161132.1 restriction endonuclease subunit S [Vibrio parahaemolyticus]ELA8162029.1 restriction endonuclease subunit S [Vibrio parahaemolyticus]MBE4329681.1 restriction endonuclease subunit S [Vibrio parahaemolyticus]
MTDKQTVKFGDICKEVKLTTKDPIGDGYERYIGLEHLDSGSLKIKRWGMIVEDNPSFTRVFKKGQILFGKRRPYLKKAAIAEFDGICSGDIIVMEAKPNLTHKELLPHIIQSKVMWNWAIQNSSGSLSPRTKFSVLKELEITLPEKQQMSRCLEVIDKAQECFDGIDLLHADLYKIKTKLAYDRMLKGNWYRQIFMKPDEANIPKGWRLTTIGDVLIDTQYGLSEALEKAGEYPVLRMMNITNGYVDPNDMKYLSSDYGDAEKYTLNKGDLVFNRTNSMEWVGRTGIFELDDKYLFASYLIRLVVDESQVSPFYLNQYLNLPLVQYRLKAFATPGVSQANINPGSLKSLPILLPPIDEIAETDTLLRLFDENIKSVVSQKHDSMSVLENLKSEYFS